MGSAFHQLCPRYSGTLTPTAPTAIRLWDTFTFFTIALAVGAGGGGLDILTLIYPFSSFSLSLGDGSI